MTEMNLKTADSHTEHRVHSHVGLGDEAANSTYMTFSIFQFRYEPEAVSIRVIQLFRLTGLKKEK
ncbi:MAG: hypothetical protein COZ23_04760, partial [Hydrogenophilales bacterium CG_4_10_14_3_um_filter_58_23]